MPFVRTALIATAACLFGAAAYAQTSTTDQAPPAAQSMQPAPDTTMPPAASTDTSAAPSTDAAAQAPASSGAMTPAPDTTAPVGAAANTSTTVDASGNQVIASQPVPDTRANRAAYGSPLSNAGKHTAPAGN
jgi:hypothetical protein